MRYRIDYDKKRMKKVEKLLIVCFCRKLLDSFVVLYIGRNKDRRKREEDVDGFVYKENFESNNHICNFSCYIYCSIPDSFYVKLYTFKQYGGYD